MARTPPVRTVARTLAQHRDARDLRAAVAAALAPVAIGARMLREAVWNYVRGDGEVAVALGVVMPALANVVERARLASESARIARMRDVVRRVVEAYVGRLGGVALGAARATPPGAPGALV